ncbi:MAG: S26 family signal peptidase [Acidimicrobiia bacterium]
MNGFKRPEKALFVLFTAAVLCSCSGDDDSTVQPTDGPMEHYVFEGGSMSPTLEDGDPIEVFDYAEAAPARGDVIAFAAPTSPYRVFFNE